MRNCRSFTLALTIALVACLMSEALFAATHNPWRTPMPVLSRMIGFLVTSDPERAKMFYRDVLGFRMMGEDEYAVVFDANGTMLRLNKGRDFKPAQGTVLGWEVDDIHAAIRELESRGVHFEQFNLPFIKQDELGVWTPPNGDRVAWFKDPDGNVLSISQHVRKPSRQ
jgi:catechol 2,3-dioxygenase-like lactoylglutathione lyase family enzyme